MKLTHIEHIEDNLMVNPKGVIQALEQMQLNKMKFSLKWDGAPALIFGMCPASGQFFMGTKAIFNKDPKINYTQQDILAHHGSNSNLCSKLMYVFEVLKATYSDTRVFQADLLFCNGDLSKDKQLSFTPNALTYVPSREADRVAIRAASIGLAIHTEYKQGKTLMIADMSAVPTTGLPDMNESVYLAPTKVEMQDHNVHITRLCQSAAVNADEETWDQQFVDKQIIDSGLWAEYKIFYNWCIQNDECSDTAFDFKFEYPKFIEWLINRYAKKMTTKKTHAGMKTQMYAMDAFLGTIHDQKVKSHFMMFHQNRARIIDLKEVLLHHLNIMSPFCVRVGDHPYKHEGYVIQNKSGEIMKLVDRKQFSKLNFAINLDRNRKQG